MLQLFDCAEVLMVVTKASFTSKDACVEPHGRVYASRLFTRQHLTTTEPIIFIRYSK